MSGKPPNYCGPHDTWFNRGCPACSGEWFGTLSRIEQALVLLVSQPGVLLIGAKKYIEEFRKMEAA